MGVAALEILLSVAASLLFSLDAEGSTGVLECSLLPKGSATPVTAAADVTEDLEKRRSASLNFLLRLSALLPMFL